MKPAENRPHDGHVGTEHDWSPTKRAWCKSLAALPEPHQPAAHHDHGSASSCTTAISRVTATTPPEGVIAARPAGSPAWCDRPR